MVPGAAGGCRRPGSRRAGWSGAGGSAGGPRRPRRDQLDAVGTLISNESVVLRPEVPGRIAAINFAEGGMVTKGDVLVELDSSIERAELHRPRRSSSWPAAISSGPTSCAGTMPARNASLDEADAGLRTADAAVDLAQARLDKRKLVAPFDARAGLRNVSPGDFVDPDTTIVNLEQIDPLKVDFRVPELFLPDRGARASGSRWRSTPFPAQLSPGMVKALDPLVDAAGRRHRRARRDRQRRSKLRPGLFARVRLTLAERQNALFVPEQSIQPQGDQAFVFKVVDPAMAKRWSKLTPVTLGNRRRGRGRGARRAGARAT